MKAIGFGNVLFGLFIIMFFSAASGSDKGLL